MKMDEKNKIEMNKNGWTFVKVDNMNENDSEKELIC